MSRVARAVGGVLLAVGIGIALFTVFFIHYCIWTAIKLLEKPHELASTFGSWGPFLIMMILLASLGAALAKSGADLIGMSLAREGARGVAPGPPPPPTPRPTAEAGPRAVERGAEAALPSGLPPIPPRRAVEREEERPPRISLRPTEPSPLFPPPPRAEGLAPEEEKPGAPEERKVEGPSAGPALPEDELSRILRILRERRRRT
ncbi:hypothetical protein DRO32_02695 [Candidatus Bathyarchaeota archaeon]|nr:MAG: hypothetical protein DRO32_02695 [Candidatus Bathyarchaeota archaeon]